jgi:cell division ATPase FtsA
MPGHVVTITVPEMVYEQIRQAAERSHRLVDDVLAEAVAAAADGHAPWNAAFSVGAFGLSQ